MKSPQVYRYFYTKSELKFLRDLDKYSVTKFKPNNELNILIENYRKSKSAIKLDAVVSQVMRFIVSIAKRHKTAQLDIRDLVHEALEGVIEAIDYYYKIETPEKFITYIKPIVERRIKDSVDSVTQAVELPKNIKSEQGKLKGASQIASTAMIYSKYNIKYLSDFKSLNRDAASNKLESIEVKFDTASLIFDINRILNTILTMIEKTIIMHSFGLNNELPKSLDSISDILKVTPQRIGDLKVTALNKIRNNKAAISILKKYLN